MSSRYQPPSATDIRRAWAILVRKLGLEQRFQISIAVTNPDLFNQFHPYRFTGEENKREWDVLEDGPEQIAILEAAGLEGFVGTMLEGALGISSERSDEVATVQSSSNSNNSSPKRGIKRPKREHEAKSNSGEHDDSLSKLGKRKTKIKSQSKS